MVIDLLEWKSPRDDSPPYPNLYRPGLARIALSSSDIDADFDFLVSNGVEVVSANRLMCIPRKPATRDFSASRIPTARSLELVAGGLDGMTPQALSALTLKSLLLPAHVQLK